MFRSSVKSPPTEVLPGVNTLVKIALPAPARYGTLTRPAAASTTSAPSVLGTALAPAMSDLLELASRVEDIEPAAQRRGGRRSTLYVAAPRYPGDREGPEPSSRCRVIWPSPAGIYALPTRFEGRALVGPRVRAWRLAVDGPVERVQRRRYFRVPWVGPVTLEVMPGEELQPAGSWPGLTAIVPGEGLQVLTGTTVDLSEGGLRVTLPAPGLPDRTAIRVLLPVRDEVLVLPATTVWSRPAPRPAVRLTETGISFDDVERYGDVLRREVVEAQLRARRVGLV
jgi:hypothetical protein